MSAYTINDLRGDLAATIKELRAGNSNMTVEKAKAIGELAQTMINSAKVEVDMLRAVGDEQMRPTGFIGTKMEAIPAGGQDGEPAKQLDSPQAGKPHIRNPMGSAPRASL